MSGKANWWNKLTPEQQAEHVRKMQAARHKPVPVVYNRDTPPVELSMAPKSDGVTRQDTDPYLQLFRNLLGEYVNGLSALNAFGAPMLESCKLCFGGGIHSIGCGCVCHRARKALAEYDQSRTSMSDLR